MLDVLDAAQHEAVTSGGLGPSAQTASLLAASKALGQMLAQEDREWFFKADESPYVAAFVQASRYYYRCKLINKLRQKQPKQRWP